MTVKTPRQSQIVKQQSRGNAKAPLARRRYNARPFWLPASSYYVLTAAVAGVVFFFCWGILFDGGEEMPWIYSGMAASFVLGGAVLWREVILRKARTKYLQTEKKLDANIRNISAALPPNSPSFDKLTVEKNAAFVREIQHKSEAAKMGGTSAEAHLKVFEMCDEYLALNRRQLETVGIGSPRLAALRRGKEVVAPLHRAHLLAWAQTEARRSTQESKIRVTISDKVEAAQRALTVLDLALSYYPDDSQLLESEQALKEFAHVIKVSHWIEQAERAAFKGNHKRAINHYRDALYFMARDGGGGIQNEAANRTAEKINAEIERLRALSAKKPEDK